MPSEPDLPDSPRPDRVLDYGTAASGGRLSVVLMALLVGGVLGAVATLATALLGFYANAVVPLAVVAGPVLWAVLFFHVSAAYYAVMIGSGAALYGAYAAALVLPKRWRRIVLLGLLAIHATCTFSVLLMLQA